MSEIRWNGSVVVVALDESWRALLDRSLQMLQELERDEAVAGRLSPDAHPDTPTLQDAYQETVAADLATARNHDRDLFAASLHAESLDLETAECWMRVVGDARLAIAAKRDVDEKAMERADDAGIRVVHMLGHIQDELVAAVGDGYYGH